MLNKFLVVLFHPIQTIKIMWVLRGGRRAVRLGEADGKVAVFAIDVETVSFLLDHGYMTEEKGDELAKNLI